MPVDRRCDQCEWAKGVAAHFPMLTCHEGPQRVQVNNDHWCGRFRLAESLTGNKDVRTPDEQ